MTPEIGRKHFGGFIARIASCERFLRTRVKNRDSSGNGVFSPALSALQNSLEDLGPTALAGIQSQPYLFRKATGANEEIYEMILHPYIPIRRGAPCPFSFVA